MAYRSLIFDPPGCREAVPELLQALAQRSALAEAEFIAVRATERFRDDSRAWLELGHIRQKLGRAAAAIDAYRQALVLDDQGAHAWAGLAQVYERLHRLEEALEAIDAAINLLPGSNYLRHCRGVILRRMGRLEEAKHTQHGVLSATADEDALLQHRVWHELCQVHRAAGDLPASHDALARCKTAQAPLAEPLHDRFTAYQAEVAKRFDGLSGRTVKRWGEQVEASNSMPTPQTAFIVGHPRSGTTLTEQVLAAHPAVVTLDEKEVLPHVEATVFPHGAGIAALDRVGPDEQQRFRQLYLHEVERYLATPLAGRYLIDKRPDSLLMVPTILRMMRGAKLLVVIRDPRDVCASCYRQAFELGIVSAQFISIESTCRYYAWFMSHWLYLRDVLPGKFWHEVRYESLVSEYESNTRSITAFLGLGWDPAMLAPEEAASDRLIATPSYAAVTSRPNRDAIGGWQEFADAFEPCRPVLQPFLDAFGYQ